MPILASNVTQINKHLTVTSCKEIADLMLPMLEKHGITVFNYYRMYFDGSAVRFSTDRAWTEHYFQKGYLNLSTVPAAYLSKQLNYFIWLTDDMPEILLDAALNFNTSNGISIAERHPDYIEYFCFGTTTDNHAIVNHFYINHLDVLQKYGFYFREQAAVLLKRHEHDKIILDNKDVCTMHSDIIKPLNHSKTIKLSHQQDVCARLLLRGSTVKEISNELYLSPRTVESYLNNLKLKLHCENRTQLIVKLIDILN